MRMFIGEKATNDDHKIQQYMFQYKMSLQQIYKKMHITYIMQYRSREDTFKVMGHLFTLSMKKFTQYMIYNSVLYKIAVPLFRSTAFLNGDVFKISLP